ncbi:MAG TPA: histidine phosphatase family protein [Candidatus Dormibacteraeota bacterium]|nr:histidine phosphatase family protein [Candidatus Dormibacteraeota bacterium]
MSATRLIILRHGETTWNREGRFQGHLDSPLTPAGLEQAHALARRLTDCAFTALYSSDLGRAEATARIIAEATGQTVRLDCRLRERNLGVLQGLLLQEAREKFPDAYALFKHGGVDEIVPGGESTRQRCDSIMACVSDLAKRHRGEQIVVVTHGGSLSCLIRYVLGIELDAPRRFSRPNASWNVFVHRAGHWFLETWGDTSHLREASGLDDLG